MTEKAKKYWVYALSILFIAANSALVALEFYWFALVPLVLVLILMAFFALDKLLLFIVFFTPLSVSIEEMDIGGIGMFLPTEPLMFGVMLLFFLKLLYDFKFDSRVLKHPVTISIFIYLFWIFFTSITSELPVVSFKFLLSRMWFIVCFYFLGTQLFRKYKNVRLFHWLYIIPLSAVIIYTFSRLAMHGFEEKPAHWVMNPFFKDHTSYGASIAMFLPVLIHFLFKPASGYTRMFTLFLMIIFTVGIVFSYTRGAWVSVAASLVLYLIYKFRVKFSYLAISAVIGLMVLFSFWSDIKMTLEENRQDSSGELSEHVQSISNISTDASNLERMNRWASALRMFEERPVLGWGPGTYTFLYAPFQRSTEKTIISTNAGDLGNAHSEYIGPLAESGIIGTLSFVLIIIVVYYRGSKLYHRLPPGEFRGLLLSVLVGLFTYVVHGMINNYLDTDKAAVPFWGFIAFIVAADIYFTGKEVTSGAPRSSSVKPESK